MDQENKLNQLPYDFMYIKEETCSTSAVNMCRLCLKRNTHFVDIYGDMGLQLDLSNRIKLLFGQSVSHQDNWPHIICGECLEKINKYNSFYQIVKENEKTLHELFGVLIVTNKDNDYQSQDNIADTIIDNDFNIKISEEKENSLKEKVIASEIPTRTLRSSNLNKSSEQQQNCSPSCNICLICNSQHSNLTSLRAHIKTHSKKEIKPSKISTITKEEIDDGIKIKLEPIVLIKPLENDDFGEFESNVNDDDDDEDDDDYIENENEDDSSDWDMPLANRKIGRQKKPVKINDKSKRLIKKKCKIKKSIEPYRIINTEERKNEDIQIKTFFKMECELCAYKFNKFADVRTHYRETHNMKGYLICCGKKFDRRFKVLQHITHHINPDAFKCSICLKVYKNQYALRTHAEMHAPPELKHFKCEKCPQSFTRVSRLRAHLISHIPKEKKEYVCPTCGKAFALQSILQGHIRHTHENRDTQICEICAKVFKSKDVFQRHQTEHLENKPPKVKCPICGMLYKHKFAMRKHMKRHENTNDIHQCQICNKISPNRLALEAHVKYMHAKERKHKCTLCDKGFKTPIGLREHTASHTGEILYTCLFCPKQFNSNANKYVHQKKKHPVEWQADKEKKKQS